jgi:uncharacterized integral membrane protein
MPSTSENVPTPGRTTPPDPAAPSPTGEGLGGLPVGDRPDAYPAAASEPGIDPLSQVESGHHDGSALDVVPDSSDLKPPPTTEPARPSRVRLAGTRTSTVWLGVWAGLALLILLIIFVAQNTANVRVNFLWLHGTISLALALLIACVGGAAIALAAGAARIIQLRREVRRIR